MPMIGSMKERSTPVTNWRVRTGKKKGKFSSSHCKAEMLFLCHVLGQNAASSPAFQCRWLESTFPSYMTRYWTLFPVRHSKPWLFHVKKGDTWNVHLATAEGAERACSCFSKSSHSWSVLRKRDLILFIPSTLIQKQRHSLYQWEKKYGQLCVFHNHSRF